MTTAIEKGVRRIIQAAATLKAMVEVISPGEVRLSVEELKILDEAANVLLQFLDYLRDKAEEGSHLPN